MTIRRTDDGHVIQPRVQQVVAEVRPRSIEEDSGGHLGMNPVLAKIGELQDKRSYCPGSKGTVWSNFWTKVAFRSEIWTILGYLEQCWQGWAAIPLPNLNLALGSVVERLSEGAIVGGHMGTPQPADFISYRRHCCSVQLSTSHEGFQLLEQNNFKSQDELVLTHKHFLL